MHVQDLQLLLLPVLAASRRDLVTVGMPVLVFLLLPVNVITVAAATPLLASALAAVVALPHLDDAHVPSPVPLGAG
jgi:hypothetical protein